MILLAWLALGVLVAVATHEGAHYAACRALGADAALTIQWDGVNTTPAIETPLRDHTPTSVRLVALAPLAVLAPVATALWVEVVAVPTHPPAAFALAVWCVGMLPSIQDARLVWYAGEVRVIRDAEVSALARPHAVAEGIAA